MSDFSDFDQEKISSLRATLHFIKICCPEYFVLIRKINEDGWNLISPFFYQEFVLSPNSTIGLSLINDITEE